MGVRPGRGGTHGRQSPLAYRADSKSKSAAAAAASLMHGAQVEAHRQQRPQRRLAGHTSPAGRPTCLSSSSTRLSIASKLLKVGSTRPTSSAASLHARCRAIHLSSGRGQGCRQVQGARAAAAPGNRTRDGRGGRVARPAPRLGTGHWRNSVPAAPEARWSKQTEGSGEGPFAGRVVCAIHTCRCSHRWG